MDVLKLNLKNNKYFTLDGLEVNDKIEAYKTFAFQDRDKAVKKARSLHSYIYMMNRSVRNNDNTFSNPIFWGWGVPK